MFEAGTVASYKRLILKTGYTDLRCGIQALSTELAMLYGVDWSRDNDLYLFCGRSCRKVRGLVHTKDGFVMINIQLDTLKVKWPRRSDELREITLAEFSKVLQGGAIQ